MEEKKLDLKTIIGFGLIVVLMLWMIFNQTSNKEKEQSEKEKKEQIEKATEKQIPEPATATVNPVEADSLKAAKLKSSLGAFAYSASLPSAKDTATTIKNE
ncbi:MAG: membrane protein insertase YidC, partial [Bacteroidota bacterium]